MKMTFAISLLLIYVWCSAAVSQAQTISLYVAAPESSDLTFEVDGHSSQRDTFGGGEAVRQIVRTTDPILIAQPGVILEAKLHEVRDPAYGSERTWAVVRLFFSREFKAQVDQLYSLHPEYYLLVRLNEHFVDMEPLGAYPSEGFAGGVFGSIEEARVAYEEAGIKISVVKPLEAEVKDRARFEREYRNGALWIAKCDPESFEQLRAEGIDRVIGPIPSGALDGIDCGKRRPPFPPAPPGRPDVCVDASESGEMDGGQRHGAWTVTNPYGQQIRMDFYKHGVLDGSVWLRDCGEKAPSKTAEPVKSPST